MLHITARDILFWTPRRQFLRNKRIIPVTNIAELVKYVLLPYNDDVTKPRALNTFLERLIKNKKLLSDLIEKEKGYRDGENASKNKSNVESLSDGEEEGEEIVLRMVVKPRRPKKVTTTVRKQKVLALKRRPSFTLKIPVNIVRILMCTGH